MTNAPGRNPANVVDAAVRQLSEPDTSSSKLSLETRIQLCRDCLDGVVDSAEEWAQTAAEAKRLDRSSPLRAEDLLSGPTVVARQLQLTIQTLRALQSGRPPKLPGSPTELAYNQVQVPVFPTAGFFDHLTFMGLRATVRMQPGVDKDSLHGERLPQVCEGQISGISAVLGAGNVSSIPATDSLNRILFEGRRVLLKMNPVNEYLAPIFEQAFAPLVRRNLLVIVTGDADVGARLIRHDRISDVHITGSASGIPVAATALS